MTRFVGLLILLLIAGCESSTTKVKNNPDPDPFGQQKPEPEPTETPPAGSTKANGMATIIVAQGYMGRSTISCDDGKTWIADRSWVTEGDEMVCGSRAPQRCGGTCLFKTTSGGCTTDVGCDCGHSPGFGKGVAFGNGLLVATYGWGRPGKVIKSTNGIDWETSTTFTYSDYGGLAWAQNKFVLATISPRISTDGAVTWPKGPKADYRTFSGPEDTVGTQLSSVRHFIAFKYMGQERFLGISDGDMLISTDGANTWVRPTTLASECGRGRAFAGNNLVFTASSSGNICRSTDGGMNWTLQKVANYISSDGIWTGTHFHIWGDWNDRPTGAPISEGFNMYKSPDGITWTKHKMATQTGLNRVVFTPKNTFVAANGNNPKYENQAFIYSKDGLTWNTGFQSAPVDDRHGITNMSIGEVNASALCPANQ